MSEVRVLDLGPRLCGEMGSHTPVTGKSGDRNPVEPPNNCPGAGHRKSLQDIPAEFESQTDNQSSRSPIGRGGRLRPYSVLVRIQPGVPIRGWHKDAPVPCKDGPLGALPSTSTTQQNTKRSSSTAFNRGLAGSSPVCCTKLLSSSWTRTPLSQGGDRGS